MSASSYPSPISSSSPPTPTSSTPTERSSWPPMIPVELSERDTDQTLRQASEALQGAYRRIRALRNNLLQLSEEAHLPSLRINSEVNSSIGPNHGAIMLTGQSTDESGLDRFRTSYPQAVERLRQFEASLRESTGAPRLPRRPLSSLDESPQQLPPLVFPPDTTQSILSSGLQSPVSPPRQNLLPRRPLQESYQALLADNDPFTDRGRRVAARVAHSPTSSSSLISRLNEQIERDRRELSNLRDLHDLELTLLSNYTPSRHSEPAIGSRVPHAMQIDERPTRSLDSNTARAPVGGQNATRQFWNLRRARMLRGPTLVTATSPSSSDSRQTNLQSTSSPQLSNGRLSTLSNFSSMQNLSTPTSTEPTVLFDEPSSFVQSPTASQPTDLWDMDLSNFQLPQRAIEARSLNRDVNSWDESWSFQQSREDEEAAASDSTPHARRIPFRALSTRPMRPTTIAQPRRSSTTHQRDDTVQIRRRGEAPTRRNLARYDADGNEVTSDDEGDSEYIRVQQRNHLQAVRTAQLDNMRSSSFMPTTRGSLVPDINDEDEWSLYNAMPRVRLSRHQYDADLDGELIGLLQKEQPLEYGSDEPFYVNPLPTPLHEMDSLLIKSATPPVVSNGRVHKFASFAGR